MTGTTAPAAVVFDLDGVLIESESLWDAARRALVAERGGSWRDSATRDMLGMSAPEWSRYGHEELGVDLSPSEIDDEVVDRVIAEYRHALPLLPGAVRAVESLSERWPLGLATSANRRVIDEVLAIAGLSARFTVTVSGEEVARGKPAPDVYLAAARDLGVEPAACVAIEDSENGLRSAAAAGMSIIAIPNRDFPPSPEALALADETLRSLESLNPEVVERAAAHHRT